MKLLLVHRYIRPDSPGYAHILYIMGQRFAAAGHDVTIFSAQPSYNDSYSGEPLPRKQIVDGMTIIRTPLLKENKRNAILRSINMLIFGVSLFIHSVFRRNAYDLMTVTTFPPVIMAFVARMIGVFRKTRYVYHCMDLHPEVGLASGILKRKWLTKIAAYFDKRNCESAQAVVVLSEDMLDTVRKRGVSNQNIYVINNFIIDSVNEAIEVPEVLRNDEGKFRVLFAGNLGRFQNLDTVMAAAHLVSEKPDSDQIEFWFVGAGLMVDALKQQAGDLLERSVFFHPYLPIPTVMSVIAQSHLGLVTLSPNVISCAYPSKTMSYLEAGCRLLVLVEPDSELAGFVENESLGVVCGQPSPDSVASAIESEFELWKSKQYDRNEVQEIGRRFFSQDVILNRWTELLNQLDR